MLELIVHLIRITKINQLDLKVKGTITATAPGANNGADNIRDKKKMTINIKK